MSSRMPSTHENNNNAKSFKIMLSSGEIRYNY